MSSHKKRRDIDASLFAKRAAEYFRKCDRGTVSAACDLCECEFGEARCNTCPKKARRPYTLSGLCLALGVTKSAFEKLKKDAAFSDAVEMALLRIEAFIEENSIAGQINGTLALAILKERFGWGGKPDGEGEGTMKVVLSKEVKRFAK